MDAKRGHYLQIEQQLRQLASDYPEHRSWFSDQAERWNALARLREHVLTCQAEFGAALASFTSRPRAEGTN